VDKVDKLWKRLDSYVNKDPSKLACFVNRLALGLGMIVGHCEERRDERSGSTET
jgi:hypothetical protein